MLNLFMVMAVAISVSTISAAQNLTSTYVAAEASGAAAAPKGKTSYKKLSEANTTYAQPVDFVVNACRVVDGSRKIVTTGDLNGSGRMLSPEGEASSIQKIRDIIDNNRQENEANRWQRTKAILAQIVKQTVVKPPNHGSVEWVKVSEMALSDIGNYDKDPDERSEFFYTPEPGYFGPDNISFLVELKNGLKIRVDQTIGVNVGGESTLPENCPVDPGDYRLNYEWCASRLNECQINSEGKPIQTVLDSWLQQSDFANVLAAASRTTLSFTSLAGATIGQTQGKGSKASISLDNNAAGHGWFIDNTPYRNEEFEATAQPNIWQAKAGSAAANKMDMLSVLLHEYGHVLGLGHSQDKADAMSSHLAPGMRKLPTAQELRAMVKQLNQIPNKEQDWPHLGHSQSARRSAVKFD